MSRLNPYLNFGGNARQVMEFYHSVFGGQLTVSTFGELGGMGLPVAEHDLVMHSQLETPQGFTIMAADTPSSHGPYTPPSAFSISIDTDDDDALIDRLWAALSEGATVTMPLGTPPWGGRFGMLTDRFGIDWLLSVNAPRATPPAAG